MEARLKPRGVPAEAWLLFVGKCPLLLASEREGAMCEGSSTYVLTRLSWTEGVRDGGGLEIGREVVELGKEGGREGDLRLF